MDTLSYKTISANKATVDKQWVLVDADGQTLGRMCSQVAKLLRGKHKPLYTPHADCGDNVIILNADKIRLTGLKWDQKEYVWHSGYPGGQKRRTAKEMMAKKPTAMVEKAIKGCLPHTKLGRELFRNLFVYTGTEHKHEAQKPTAFTLKY